MPKPLRTGADGAIRLHGARRGTPLVRRQEGRWFVRLQCIEHRLKMFLRLLEIGGVYHEGLPG